MDIETDKKIIEAASAMKKGEIVAYPTSTVYGLGCDPLNMDAVIKLLQMKNRSIKKGFILIASDWPQLEPFVQPIAPRILSSIQATWPGPETWVFPASEEVPLWVKGNHSTVAVRITAHPIAKALCEAFGGPIISTSANKHGFPPISDKRTLEMTFGKELATILPGKVGERGKPSKIRDALTGEVLREG